jgi:hypothetical protein
MVYVLLADLIYLMSSKQKSAKFPRRFCYDFIFIVKKSPSLTELDTLRGGERAV